MQRKMSLIVSLAMAEILLFSGVSLAGLCSDLGKDAGCVRSVDIKNEHVRDPDIKPDTITGAKIKDGTIRGRDLADEAVNSAKLSEDIILGDSGNNGSLVVRASNLRNYLAASGTTTNGGVVVGQSGGTGMDVDFYVYDPTEVDTAAHIDASEARLILGSGTGADPGDDGNITLEDGEGNNSIELDGDTGTVQNNLLVGNGLVKAWARINADGTVLTCWRCNNAPAATQRISNPGVYEVSFSPLATDIQSRPRLAVLDSHSTNTTGGEINLANRSADNTSVWVGTRDSNGAFANRAFTLIIF